MSSSVNELPPSDRLPSADGQPRVNAERSPRFDNAPVAAEDWSRVSRTPFLIVLLRALGAWEI